MRIAVKKFAKTPRVKCGAVTRHRPGEVTQIHDATEAV